MVAISNVDPISRRATVTDLAVGGDVTALILSNRFEGMAAEKLVYKELGVPAHENNGTILKLIKASYAGHLPIVNTTQMPAEPITSPAPLKLVKPAVVDVPSDGPVSADVHRVRDLLKRLAPYGVLKGNRIPINFEDTDLIYFIRLQHARLLSNGILNQHQTQNSNGTFAPQARKHVEDTLLGYDVGYDAAALNFRPKSVYLNIRNEENYGWFSDNLLDHYGRVAVVLKTKMKRQAVWSLGDSLDNLDNARSVNDPDVLSNFGGFHEATLPKSEGLYLEALVFGKIGIEDIDHLLVLNQNDAAELRHLGVPIFLMNVKRVKGRFVFTKGELFPSP